MTSPVYAIETSAVVAALLSWHEFHAVAREAIEHALDSDDHPILPAHALFESYAVMTRLPPPNRLRSEDAFGILQASFADAVRIVSLSPGSSWKFIADLAKRNIAGGRTYDELILAAVLRAGATHLITLNPRHFDAKQIDLVVPGR